MQGSGHLLENWKLQFAISIATNPGHIMQGSGCLLENFWKLEFAIFNFCVENWKLQFAISILTPHEVHMWLV